MENKKAFSITQAEIERLNKLLDVENIIDTDNDRNSSELWEEFLIFGKKVEQDLIRPDSKDKSAFAKSYIPSNDHDLKKEHLKDIEQILNCRLERNIGQGGFANVKLVFSKSQKKHFAIKIVNINNEKFRSKNENENRNFIMEEVKIGVKTCHENIVALQGFINYKDYYILVLEYLSRGDLKLFMQTDSEKKKTELFMGYVVFSVLKAISFLKSKAIVHRDIKPENILIDADFNVKLADFTLARKIQEGSSLTPSRSGTLPYLPPECVTKKKEIKFEDLEKLDIFSLGVVFFDKLLEQHPYGYKNSLSADNYATQIAKKKIDFPSSKKITKPCKDFLKKMLDKNISKRIGVESALNHPFMQGIQRIVAHYREKFNGSPELFYNALLAHDDSSVIDTSVSAEKDLNTKILGRKRKSKV